MCCWCAQSALQAQGQNWGLTLESATAALPQGRQNVAHVCKKTYGSWCLDGTDLNASGVKAIIAVGVIIIVLAITALLVWVDLRRRTGQVLGPSRASLSAMELCPSSSCMHGFRAGTLAGMHGAAAEVLSFRNHAVHARSAIVSLAACVPADMC